MTLPSRIDAPPGGDRERRRRLVGIALMCCALICFACLDASAKWVNRYVDPLQTVWARYAVSVALVALFVNPVTSPGVSRTRRPWLQAGRSLLLLLSTALNFYALQYLQLAEAIAIQFMTPFLVALMAGPLLGERVGPERLAAISVGFLGVLVITRPGLGGMHPAAILSALGSVCYALYGISTRLLAAHDSSRTTMFYSGLAGVALTTPLLPLVWTAPPSPLAWALLVSVGFFGGVGHWLLILAHARAPAPILSPFIYTQIVWMIAFGWLVFGQLPDAWTLGGAGIVVASGLYLLSRERSRG
ncbi:MAG TPA: DMT family transporter [Salinarimonas sp.]|nr:DMT family transporter [Salinarimonas sp.]